MLVVGLRICVASFARCNLINFFRALGVVIVKS